MAQVTNDKNPLYYESRQHLLELEVLHKTSLAISQIHSLPAIAQRIVDTIENLLKWNASIWLVEDQIPDRGIPFQ